MLQPSFQALARPSRSLIDIPPEILLYIGHHLPDAEDLAPCALVSKEWHKVFSPLLYAVINLRNHIWLGSLYTGDNSPVITGCHGPGRKAVRAPSAEAFCKYGHHIEHFELREDRLLEENVLCTIISLKQLKLGRPWHSTFHLDGNRILFTNNASLRVLELDTVELRNEFSWITQACPNLEVLRICKSLLDMLDVAKGLIACRSLLFLSFKSCTFVASENRPLQDEALYFGLVELDIIDCIGSGSWYLLDLIPQCPQLRSIKFEYDHGDDYKDVKVRLNHCQNLSNVTFQHVQDDKEIAKILDSCPKSLEELTIRHSTVGEHTVESVRRHFNTLTAFRLVGIGSWLSISGAGNDAGVINEQMRAELKMTKEVLRSCPNLIHLECPRLESAVLLPEETMRQTWDYSKDTNFEIVPSPLGSIGLKTLKVGLLDRSLWIGEEGIDKSGPVPAMEQLEEVEFTSIFRILGAGRYGMYDYNLCPEGTYRRPKLELDRKVRWLLKLWPKLNHFVNGNK